MSIESENRELLFQELYNMVGYHLAQHGQMPRLLFDDENPKSSDPTKHVVYKEDEGKIVIHTGRFKMKEAKIKERLREGFECEIGVDGQTGNVKFDFTPKSMGDNSIKAVDLDGYLTRDGRILPLSQDRKEKYYTEKKAPLKDRNPEDDNERLEEQFNNIPNKGTEANSNSVQNIMNNYGPVTPQQPGSQPSGQRPKSEGWLTETVFCYPSLRDEGIDMLLGTRFDNGLPQQEADVIEAVKTKSSKWGKNKLAHVSLRRSAQLGGQVGMRAWAGRNGNLSIRDNRMNQNDIRQNRTDYPIIPYNDQDHFGQGNPGALYGNDAMNMNNAAAAMGMEAVPGAGYGAAPDNMGPRVGGTWNAY